MYRVCVTPTPSITYKLDYSKCILKFNDEKMYTNGVGSHICIMQALN